MYKILNTITGHQLDVETESPEQYIIDNNLEGYVWYFLQPVMPKEVLKVEDQLDRDIIFGQTLIKEFLKDNRNDLNVKTSDSLILLQKFQAVKELLSLGDIKKCVPLIEYMTVDSIFTQDRKTKYLNMINSYLAN